MVDSGMPRLQMSPVDVAAWRAHSRGELTAALDSVPLPAKANGGHALVIDPSLSGPLGLVSEVKEFKAHGVAKIYHLLPEPLVTDCTSIIYFIRPQLKFAEQVAAQVRALENERSRGGEPQRTYTLFFVPRRSMLCEKVLGDEGVYELMTVQECTLPLFVLEDDVVSLEQPECFRECFLDSDHSVLHTCATALVRVQAFCGTIPTVQGKGRCSQIVVRMMRQMMSEAVSDLEAEVAAGGAGGTAGAFDSLAHGSPQIAELLLLDRDVDLVTPLCTELTYEGLIHSVLGISHGYVDLQPEMLGAEKGAAGASSSRLIKRELNNNDALYAQLRNLNFGEVGPLLNRLARDVSDGYEERHAAQTVSQIREFMKKLSRLQQEHKSLATHVALAERIQQVTREEAFHRRLECEQEALANGSCSADAEALIEDLAAEGEPLPSLLRLLCLLSVVSNGLRPKTLAHVQTEITHAYGFERLALCWSILGRLGLLKKYDGSNPWAKLKKGLRLMVDNMPEHEMGEEPPDLAYVYAGYAPLSVRVLHAMLAINPDVDDLLRLLPGPYFVVRQPPPGNTPSPPPAAHGVGGSNPTAAAASNTGPPTAHQPPTPASAATGASPSSSGAPVTLVCFVGGCTFAEIAALRWLGRNGTPKREYVILTTNILNGDTMMDSLMATCENGLERLE